MRARGERQAFTADELGEGVVCIVLPEIAVPEEVTNHTPELLTTLLNIFICIQYQIFSYGEKFWNFFDS